jgi:hypothetical protein
MTHGGPQVILGRLLFGALAAAITIPAVAAAPAEPPAETFGLAAPSRAGKISKPRAVAPSTRLGVDVAGSPLVALAAVDNRELMLRDELTKPLAKMLRIGVARDVTLGALDGAWTDLDGGARLWTAEVVSPGALALRLHFADLQLPPGGELAVYGLERNAGFAAGPAAERAPELLFGGGAAKASHWSGTVEGERARVEYLAPAGSDTRELPFRLDQLQHVYRDPIAEAFQEKAAGPCHNDPTCFSEWDGPARSVARYSVIFPGGSGLCTGQLINTQTGDLTPYFLTANHCVSTGDEAASTEFFWFYQTTSCNGAAPSLNSAARSQGATLVSTNTSSDYALLLVEGTLPDGLFWSGWTSAKVPVGVASTAIHHPSGDFKRISFGVNDTPAPLCGSNHVTIAWTDGPTEPGSSGGAVFRDDTQQIYGQLHGGPSACGNENFDCYGAFTTTYTKVKKQLKAGSDDNSEQNDSCGRPKTVKKGTLSNRIVKVLDEDWYKISVPVNGTLTIRLDFTHSDGDVDLFFYGSPCAAEPDFTSRGTTNSEELSLTNVSGRALTATWRVLLFNDTRNSYNQTVSIQ